MKKLFHTAIIVSLIVCLNTVIAHAATYYISASDPNASDTYTVVQAQNQATPWKSIARVNTALTSAVAGDTFLFKRGDTFVGGLSIATSGANGSPITFGAYGSGAKPIISGFATISSGWTNVGGNIWEIAAPANVDANSTLVINGTVMPLARYPRAGSANGGYLMTDNGTTSTSIVDSALGGVPAFTVEEGTEVVVRANHWSIGRAKIQSVSGTTITFPVLSSYAVGSNVGYFLQNSGAFLSQNGDWVYNPSTNKIKLYYVGTPPTVSFSSVDELVSLNTRDHITLSNLSLQGAKVKAVYGDGVSGITIDRSDMLYAGQYAIHINYGENITITNNAIRESQNNALLVNSPTLGTIVINTNTIGATGIRPGTITPLSRRNAFHAIDVNAGNGAQISTNNIDGVGYNAIRFQGNDITIERNTIKNYNLVLDDGAAIYTYNGGNSLVNPTVPQWSTRVIANNVISRGIGAAEGTASGVTQSNGIYLDTNSNHVTVKDNTLFDIANKAISMNSPQEVTVSGNTIYNTKSGIALMRVLNDGSTDNGGQDISGLGLSKNILFQTADTQTAIEYTDAGINFPFTSTIDTRIAAVGTSDTNYFRLVNPTPFGVAYRSNASSSYVVNPGRSLGQWKTFSGFDTNSTSIAVPTYRVNSRTSANLVANSGFESGITGVNGFGTLCTYNADNTSKLSGTGSLKVTVVTPTTSSTAHCESSAVVPAVSNSKKYILRFSTIGTTAQGSFQVTLMHKSSSPIVLTPWQKGSFGTGRTEHEFLFSNPTSHATPSWIIDMFAQPGGSLYIDNVELYEVDAVSITPDDGVVFQYNDTPNTKTVSLNGTYTDVTGATYTNSVVLQPYTSRVLMKSATTAPTTDTTPPTVSLQTPSPATVSGAITLTATASDSVGVTRVEFYKDTDTSAFASDTSSPYTASLNTTQLSNGVHTFKAIAYDAAGNSRTSTTVTLTITNTTTTPSTPTSSGGGGGGGGTESTTTTTPATPVVSTATAVPAVSPTTSPVVKGCENGNAYSTITGARCDGTSHTTIATITGRMVNVRATPITGAVIATLPLGTSGTVLETSTGWSKVAFATATGWVSQSLISVSTSSSVSTTPTTISTGPYNFGPVTLTTGSRGEGVKELQRFLNRYLNLGLVVDGMLGPKTTAVIRTWQSQHGLVPDGLIGAKTKAMMNSIAAQ